MSYYSPSSLNAKRRWVKKQVAQGLCVCCSSKALPNKKVCQYHDIQRHETQFNKVKKYKVQNAERQIIRSKTSQLV